MVWECTRGVTGSMGESFQGENAVSANEIFAHLFSRIPPLCSTYPTHGEARPAKKQALLQACEAIDGGWPALALRGKFRGESL